MRRKRGQRWRNAWSAALCAAVVCAASAETNVHLFCWSDLRGRLRSARLIHDPSRPPVGGAMALACRIERLRTQYAPVLLIDGGEALFGSPDANEPRENPLVRIMQRIHPDIRLIGARDFDSGYAAWKTVSDRIASPVCAANLFVPGANEKHGVIPFQWFDRGGLRIAVIGLTAEDITARQMAECMAPLQVDEEMDALERWIDAVRRSKPDILVVARRGSCRSDHGVVERMTARFPDIDLLVGTRASQPMRGYARRHTWVADAGGYGRWISHFVLSGSGGDSGAVQQADIIEVGAFNPASCRDMESMAAACAKVDRRLDEVVAVLPEEESRFRDPARGMARAVALGAGADAALQNRPSRRMGLAGAVTERDVWEMAPYDDRAVFFHATAAELSQIINDAAAHDFSLTVHGLDAVPDTAGRIGDMRMPSGSLPHPRKRFHVVISSYLAASADGRCPCIPDIIRRPECRLQVTTNRIRDCLRRGLRMAETPAYFMRDESGRP